MIITFELTNHLDELFAEILADLQVKTMRDALRAAGKIVADEMVIQAPVNTEHAPGGNSLAPGALKASIHARLSRVSADGIGSVTIGPTARTAHVARWMEYGFWLTTHAVSGKKRIRFIQPHAFIHSSYDITKDRAVEAFTQTIKNGIRAVRK